MSGGSPTVGGGYMRQRYSQGYASSGDDLEDDACSRSFAQSPSCLRTRTWVEVVENCMWIASALFIIYYGDQDYNFIYLLWHDGRIRRIPLYMGMFAVGLNAIFFFYTIMLAWGIRKSSEKWETSSTANLPAVTVLGLISFCLFSFALWPIWSFLTLPLVRYMQQHNEVELSALGMAIATVVSVAEILKNNGLAVEKKIMTSTVDVKDDSRGRPISKAKIEIVLGKTDKFDEIMATAAEDHGNGQEES
nr:transmembrane protein 128 [Ipomoea batatas]